MTPHTRTEIQRLLKRLAEGDRTAIVPAFEVLWPILQSFSARALGNEADAEDAAQQALMKLFAQVNDFDPSREGLAWIFSIATYECRTIRRRCVCSAATTGTCSNCGLSSVSCRPICTSGS